MRSARSRPRCQHVARGNHSALWSAMHLKCSQESVPRDHWGPWGLITITSVRQFNETTPYIRDCSSRKTRVSDSLGDGSVQLADTAYEPGPKWHGGCFVTHVWIQGELHFQEYTYFPATEENIYSTLQVCKDYYANFNFMLKYSENIPLTHR